jgi:large subunit ribosomal protein L18
MYKVELRKTRRARRKLGIRKTLRGSAERPRLTIFRSNKHIYAQIINDDLGVTLASVSSEAKTKKTTTKSVEAFELGKSLADKAKEVKITTVVFDRNGYRYHGRVKQLAEGVREGGLIL